MSLVPLPAKKFEVPRDHYGRPLVVPLGGGKPVPLTRTTTFIDCIEDKSNIADWKMRKAMVGFTLLSEAEQAEVVSLNDDDPEQKKRLKALAEKALALSGAHGKRDKGTDLHAISEIVDEGKPAPEGLSESDLLDMAAYQLATMDFEMVEKEEFVVVLPLLTGGTYDRLIRYTGPGPIVDGVQLCFDNELFIGDLKTGRIDYSPNKVAAQLAVYSRGLKYDHTLFPVNVEDKAEFAKWKKTEFSHEDAVRAYSEIGDVNQEWGIVVNLISGSNNATLHWADLSIGWEQALLAKTIRHARKVKGGLLPFVSD